MPFGVCNWFLMFDIAHWIMLDSFKFALNCNSISHALCRTTRLLYVSKWVAETASRLSRVFPIVAHTEPAELKLTLTASHVHAAWVFLDRTLAFRTRLRIDFKPIFWILAAIVDTINPDTQTFAVHGHMSVFRASKAEGFIASITFHVYCLTSEAFYRHRTVATRTPLRTSGELNEWFY